MYEGLTISELLSHCPLLLLELISLASLVTRPPHKCPAPILPLLLWKGSTASTSTLPYCVVGAEGTQVWKTAISGGLSCWAVSSASLYYRATFVCSCPVSFPLSTSHAQDHRDSTLALPAAFVKWQAGLAAMGQHWWGGVGRRSGHLAGAVLSYPLGDFSPLWPQSSLAEDSDCN